MLKFFHLLSKNYKPRSTKQIYSLKKYHWDKVCLFYTFQMQHTVIQNTRCKKHIHKCNYEERKLNN